MPLGTLPSSTSEPNKPDARILKTLIYDNKNYEEYVGNVILNSTNPLINVSSSEPIEVEFDLLTNTFENLQMRYVHCNFDWKPSQLREIEYLNTFNRFDHKTIEYSSNTKTHYIQYFFELSRPKISGNYLVILHRRDRPDDILFTRKLMVYSKRITPSGTVRTPRRVADRRTHQQIDFSIDFQGLEVPNPEVNFKTMVVQNKDWNSAIVNLKPTSIQPGSKQMSWEYFTGENQFMGWNQFRWLDLRTLVVRGVNVAKIIKRDNHFDVYQAVESAHGASSYRQLINDNNGRYLPGNSDPGEPWLEADYANVHFTLKSPLNVGDVWVRGRFNDWQKEARNKMRYNAEVGAYEAVLRLKQGYYDYRYVVESKDFDAYHFEGSHFQTENEYDILVYYRAPGRINDELVGLQSLNSEEYF